MSESDLISLQEMFFQFLSWALDIIFKRLYIQENETSHYISQETVQSITGIINAGTSLHSLQSDWQW